MTCKVTNLPLPLTKKGVLFITHSLSLDMTVHLLQTQQEESVRRRLTLRNITRLTTKCCWIACTWRMELQVPLLNGFTRIYQTGNSESWLTGAIRVTLICLKGYLKDHVLVPCSSLCTQVSSSMLLNPVCIRHLVTVYLQCNICNCVPNICVHFKNDLATEKMKTPESNLIQLG